MNEAKNLRNVCIIAHVDHGKTTLVDHLLRQAGTFKKHQALEDRVMDSMDLEREKGITILSKNTSVRVGDVKINIVDTPGHADFGGEVERILGMVEGALLLVDAAEGPLPQTRFVLEKALKQGHRVLLVMNKVDRPECAGGGRIRDVVNQTFDLFVELGANDVQLDFPIIYTCAKKGWCTSNFDDIEALTNETMQGTLEPLYKLILDHIPSPKVLEAQHLQVLVSNLSYSDYVGRLAIGRILSGKAVKNQKLFRYGVDTTGKALTQSFALSHIATYEGLERKEVPELGAGDIGVFGGSEAIEIGDTISNLDSIQPLPRITVEPPTLAMIFSVNTSPMSGQEGEAIQSRKLRDRLIREVRNNVALRFQETELSDQFRLLGRGELQFAILIEQMRREGFEVMVGKPLVLYQKSESGERLEPIEIAVLDLPEEHAGEVTRVFQERKGKMIRYEIQSSETAIQPRVRLEFEIPTRGLLGMRSKFLTLTRGAGLMSSRLMSYEPHRGEIPHRNSGAIICDRTGETVEYGLMSLEDRGVLFFGPGIPVYEGMVIGIHNKENDLNVNPCKEKKLTNIRSAHAEVLVTLSGVRKMSLEESLEWIDEDEWIEVTPVSVRIRKKVLNANLRSVKRSERVD